MLVTLTFDLVSSAHVAFDEAEIVKGIGENVVRNVSDAAAIVTAAPTVNSGLVSVGGVADDDDNVAN